MLFLQASEWNRTVLFSGLGKVIRLDMLPKKLPTAAKRQHKCTFKKQRVYFLRNRHSGDDLFLITFQTTEYNVNRNHENCIPHENTRYHDTTTEN